MYGQRKRGYGVVRSSSSGAGLASSSALAVAPVFRRPQLSSRMRSAGVLLNYVDFGDCDCIWSLLQVWANVDEEINDGRGPYVFKVSGQISHKIGSFCPDPTKGPRFLQLYLFDADNEVCFAFAWILGLHCYW
ncbi:unnamed protein product [Lactuca virosa]|uniref:Uncharacterized protein n=1 Tax=Lactuca virosa TaxID=75947 RepID=A0AAU9M700_9ASTR|nr:unnamed protein product [Lactuca virosa]